MSTAERMVESSETEVHQVKRKKELGNQTVSTEADTTFRLNTKRMSYQGFEFGDFGFMTTDFDQLHRGHTQLSTHYCL